MVLQAEAENKIKDAALADTKALRNEFIFVPPAFCHSRILSLLQDQRDAPVVFLLMNILTLTVPAALGLFYLRTSSHLLGFAYFIFNYVLFLQRFMLMLHFSEHKRLFQRDYDVLNYFVPYILSPFFGVPSGLYRLHHCVMHHTEDNRAGHDLSSTEIYQRDNLLHFLIYWLRYWVLAWVELPWYAARCKRWATLCSCLGTELFYLAAIRALWLFSPIATTWVFIVPFFVSSFALMFGNWSQHIFIDPSQPRSDYGLAYNCVACPDNQKTFNDGYHIVHHLNSQVHWSELPAKFILTLQQHAEHNALVFQGIGFFDVGLAVFMRRYDFLLRHLSRYSPKLAEMSETEVIALLKSRLAPIR